MHIIAALNIRHTLVIILFGLIPLLVQTDFSPRTEEAGVELMRWVGSNLESGERVITTRVVIIK